MALVVKRSDRFPIGTTVKAFAGIGGSNRHQDGRPSGPILEEATVDATGKLEFAGLGESIYSLWAIVGGENRNLTAGGIGYTAPGTLKERLAAKRAEVGA